MGVSCLVTTTIRIQRAVSRDLSIATVHFSTGVDDDVGGYVSV